MSDDAQLIRHYAETGDAEVLADIVKRYQNLVYATCLRVHGNRHVAEEAAQDCFLRLMQRAETVQSSLGGWLHRCATRICLDSLRRDRAREGREKEYAEMSAAEDQVPWEEVSPRVDEALDTLPDELRHAVIEHFLRQRTQAHIAEELGVSPATVSRRVDRGLDELRLRLKKAGVAISAALLGTLLTQNTSTAAPATLTAELGKMVIAGAGSTGGGAAAAAGEGLLASAAGKAALGLAAVVIAMVATLAYKTRPEPIQPVPQPAKPVATTAVRPPVAAQDENKQEEDTMKELGLKHGFRYDPIPWIENDDSVWAALARLNFLNKPREGDEAIINAFIDDHLAKLKPGQPPLDLAIVGCPPEHEGFRRRAIEWLDAQVAASKPMGTAGVHLACYIGWEKSGEPARSVQQLVADPGPVLDGWNPWTPMDVLRALGAAGNRPGVQERVNWWLKLLWDNTNAVGCWNKLDPGGTLSGVSAVDGPYARELVARIIPLRLRGQCPVGCFGLATTEVCQSLRKHGLFEAMRKLPPLPPDWRIAQTIAVPHEQFKMLTWGNDLFWTLVCEEGDGKWQFQLGREVVAISPADGAVVKRLPVAEHQPKGLGWYDDKLVLVSQANGGTVTLVDPNTGKVAFERRGDLPWFWLGGGALQFGKELWISHTCWLPIINPKTGAERRLGGYGPAPWDMARDGDTIWMMDGQNPYVLYHWGLHEDIIEMVDAPFRGDPRQNAPVCGITHDGKSLWALDNKSHRICRMVRVGPPKYRASKGTRLDLIALYDAMPRSEGPIWEAAFDLKGEARVTAFAEQAQRRGLKRAADGNVLYWLSAGDTIDAMFYFIDDRSDVGLFRRYYDTIREAGSPLSYIIIRHAQRYEVVRAAAHGYMYHNNQIKASTPDPLADRLPLPELRADIELSEENYWDNPNRFYHQPLDKIAAAYEPWGRTFNCTQKVENGMIVWRGDAGKVEAMSCTLDDTDLNGLCRVYDRIEATDCPETRLLLHMTQFGGGVFFLYRLTPNNYMQISTLIGDTRPSAPIAAGHWLLARRQWEQAQRRLDSDPKSRTLDQDVVLPEVVSDFGKVADQAVAKHRMPRAELVAHAVCMKAAGAGNAGYGDLAAVSGLGASFAYGPPRPGKFDASPLLALPPGAEDRMQKATGVGISRTDVYTAEKAWELIKASVDAGQPVQLPSHNGLLGFVVAGYRDAPAKADRRILALGVPYAIGLPGLKTEWWSFGAWVNFEAAEGSRFVAHPGDSPKPLPARDVIGPGQGLWWFYWQLERWFELHGRMGILRYERRQAAPVGEIVTEFLRNTVDWAENDPRAPASGKDAVWGTAALEAYAADIQDMANAHKSFYLGWRGDFAVYPLWTGRGCLAAYLKQVAGDLPEDARKSVAAAAARYGEAYAAWQKWEEHLGVEAPPRAWQTREHREAGAAAVSQALLHEKAAVEEARKALAALEREK